MERRKSYFISAIAVLCYYIGGSLASALLGLFLTSLFPSLPESGSCVFCISCLPLYLFGIPLARGILLTADADPPERRPFPWWGVAGIVVLSVAFCLSGTLLGQWLDARICEWLGTESLYRLDSMVAAAPLPVSFLITVVLAPVCEEYLFRRLLLDRLPGEKPALAILFSAFLFAVTHGNPVQFLYALPVGILLGFLYRRSGNLFLCVLSHTLINFVGVML